MTNARSEEAVASNVPTERDPSGVFRIPRDPPAEAPTRPPGELLVDPEGEITYRCRGAASWLAEPGMRAGVARFAGRLVASAYATGETRVPGARLRGIRLEGSAVPHVLVRIEPEPRSPDASIASLTPTQRRVAEYAAAGATLEEIGRAVGCARGTAKVHLAAVYRRLGVRTRVELLRVIA